MSRSEAMLHRLSLNALGLFETPACFESTGDQVDNADETFSELAHKTFSLEAWKDNEHSHLSFPSEQVAALPVYV